MDYYSIGRRIRKIRKARGLSQEMLAEKVEISTTHMSHIETGNTKMSLAIFVALASALEVHTDDLLYDISSNDRTLSMDHIIDLLSNCTTQQIRIIEDVLQALKISLSKNL